MRKLTSLLLAPLFLTSNVFAAPIKGKSIEDFSSNVNFCAYMASPPDGEAQEFIDKYELAIRQAIDELRNESSGITKTKAIFILKSLCDSTLSKPWKNHNN